MSFRRPATVVALCSAVVLIASLSAASAASPIDTQERPSRALQRWTSGSADPAAVLAAIRRNPGKVPVEFNERLRWADSDGSLQVMATLVHRDDEVESFITANTVDLSWYGDDPRFLGRITPGQLITLLDSPVVLFVEPDYPVTNFMSDSSRDVRARTPDADGVYSFDPAAGEMGQLVSNIEGLTAEQVTGSGVRVAVTDSGIDKTHRDFGGWDCEAGPYQPCESRIAHAAATEHLIGFETSDALPTTEAASGHGSHVAGTIAGNGYYTRDGDEDADRYGGDGYVIGIAPGADIVSVKNGDSQSAGFSTAALQWQLDHAEEFGIKVSSNSWGCLGGCSFNPNSATSQTVRDLYLAGVVVVFAVGNDDGDDDGENFSGFAQSPYVLGVAAYNDENAQLASFSSRGSSSEPLYEPTTWTPESEPTNGTRRPDVAAPGVSIWSARTLTGGTSSGAPRANLNDVTGGGSFGFVPYAPLSGTSMATPHVAGTAALLAGACLDAAPLDVMRAIKVGADQEKVLKTGGGAAAAPFEVGYGSLDVRAALDWLLSLQVCGGEGIPDPDPTPTPTPTSDPPREVIFEDEGRIDLPNPTSDVVGGITENEFTLTCSVPETQGTDGWVFELPEVAGAGVAAELVGSGSPIGHDLDMYFYASDCAFLGGIATPSSDEEGPVLEGTKWVVADLWLGADTLAKLTLTGPGSPELEQATVTFTERSETSGQHSDQTLFEAQLKDSDGDPIPGAELTFTLGSEESSRTFTAITDESGIGSVTPTLTENPATYPLAVRFDGDESHEGSAESTEFVIDKEDTAVELTVQGEDDDKRVVARLSDLDSPTDGVPGRTIDLYSDSELIGSDQTDDDGVATIAIPPSHRGANRTYEAVFEGDDFYLCSSDDRPGQGANNGGGNEPEAEPRQTYYGGLFLL